jgi:hypothetical protein
MTRLLLILALALGLTGAPRAAAPLDGTWDFAMSSPMGTVEAVVTLKADGTTLTGQFDLGGGRVWPIDDGVVDGDRITFQIDRDRPSGGAMTYGMSGTLKGDTITGAASAMGMNVDWTMTRK